MAKHRITCDNCGKDFFVWPTRLRNGKPRYCNLSCRDAHWEKIGHPKYKGTAHISQGYYAKTVPGRGRGIKVHRLVAEEMIGRPLRKGEVVHHRNHDKLDNRPENLEVLTIREHIKAHKMSKWARDFDHCVKCGKSDAAHQARGYCAPCFKRKWYEENRDITVSRAACDARWGSSTIK